MDEFLLGFLIGGVVGIIVHTYIWSLISLAERIGKKWKKN